MLPEREVGVLHREFGQLGRSGRVGPVVVGQFAHQDVQGPAVRHDVVDGEQQQVLLVGRLDQPGAQQRSGAQVEGAAALLFGQLGERGLPGVVGQA